MSEKLLECKDMNIGLKLAFGIWKTNNKNSYNYNSIFSLILSFLLFFLSFLNNLYCTQLCEEKCMKNIF